MTAVDTVATTAAEPATSRLAPWQDRLMGMAAAGDTGMVYGFQAGWLEARAVELARRVRCALGADDPRAAVAGVLAEMEAKYAAEDAMFMAALDVALANHSARGCEVTA